MAYKDLSGLLVLCSLLAPVERRKVTFEVGPEVSHHGTGMKRVVEPGRFQVMVGGCSGEVKSVGLDVAEP